MEVDTQIVASLAGNTCTASSVMLLQIQDILKVAGCEFQVDSMSKLHKEKVAEAAQSTQLKRTL